jgi:hypothetical protein
VESAGENWSRNRTTAEAITKLVLQTVPLDCETWPLQEKQRTVYKLLEPLLDVELRNTSKAFFVFYLYLPIYINVINTGKQQQVIHDLRQ